MSDTRSIIWAAIRRTVISFKDSKYEVCQRTQTHRTSQNTEFTKTQHTLRYNCLFVFFVFVLLDFS